MLKLDDIIALYTAMLTEEKSFLIVCKNKFDFMPTVMSILSLMHPFEWSFPVIPFVTADPNNLNKEQLEMINYLSSIIMGIHESDLQEMYSIIDPDNIDKTIIINLCGIYDQKPSKSAPKCLYKTRLSAQNAPGFDLSDNDKYKMGIPLLPYPVAKSESRLF